MRKWKQRKLALRDDLLKKMEEQKYRSMIRIHESMVAYYTGALCLAFDIEPEKPVYAALYHDHGKFFWKTDLFTKTAAELTEEDIKEIKKHPQRAPEMIFTEIPLQKPFFLRGDPSIVDLIYMHHEKPDGSGYYGIKDIPVEAALISIADVFDACLSDRGYRGGMRETEALMSALRPFWKYLQKLGYDPEVVIETLKEENVVILKLGKWIANGNNGGVKEVGK